MTTNTPRQYGPPTRPAVSLNTDASVNTAALGNLLTTIALNPQRIGYIVQNQSLVVLTVAFDDGVSSTPTPILLNAASLAGAAGDTLDMQAMPHYGRIRIFGTAGSAVAAADW